MIRLANLTPLVAGVEEDFAADMGGGAGKDFGAVVLEGIGNDFSAHAAEFDADMEEDFGANGGRGADLDIGGSRSLQAPRASVEGKSRCSLSSSLTRRGLMAPETGAAGESFDSLSLTRRGLTAPDAGAAPDETTGADFGAGATPGGSCGGAVMSRDMTSQSCREKIIFTLLIPRHGGERVNILTRPCLVSW
jgi:hypothetical protein